MTIVVELRDLKKSLPRPVSHFWQRASQGLCMVRVRIACLCLLGLALGYPADAEAVPRDGVLAMLCAVLTAAVSATIGLLCDASSGLSGWFFDHSSPAFRLEQRFSVCFGEQVFPFDLCPAGGTFPTFSAQRLCALVACALLLFGCGLHRGRSVQLGENR